LAPFRGGLFVARQRLWRYLFVPVLLNLALAVGAVWVAAVFWRQEATQSLATHPVLAWVGLVVVVALSGVVLLVALQPLLGAIFNDRLSERVEVRIRGSVPKVPFFASSGRALVHGLLKLVFYALALVMGFVLSIPSAGIGALVGIALGALFLAYDGFDYPLSRRGLGFGAKWAYLGLHPGLTLGYGLGATVLYLIPAAFVVAPPFAAVGATLAFLDDEARKKKIAAPPASAEKPGKPA
jgi:uncharacterized protein involved in cysteine biosynthesis